MRLTGGYACLLLAASTRGERIGAFWHIGVAASLAVSADPESTGAHSVLRAAPSTTAVSGGGDGGMRDEGMGIVLGVSGSKEGDVTHISDYGASFDTLSAAWTLAVKAFHARLSLAFPLIAFALGPAFTRSAQPAAGFNGQRKVQRTGGANAGAGDSTAQPGAQEHGKYETHAAETATAVTAQALTQTPGPK
eukprot:6211975-Pleurochrysis_carterae.AAC.4